MKTLQFVLSFCLFLVISPSLNAQRAKPDWVKNFETFKPFSDADSSYYGIGSSKNSQDEANAKAKEAFAMNVNSQIDITRTLSAEEKSGQKKEQYESTARITSKAILSDVTISDEWAGEGKFFALISINKSAYYKRLQDDVRFEIKRLQIEAEKAAAQKQLDFAAQKDDAKLKAQRDSLALVQKETDRLLADQKARNDLEEKERREKLAAEKKATDKALYGSFYEKQPPYRMVNIMASDISTELALKISPTSLGAGQLFAAKKYYMFQSWIMTDFREKNTLNAVEAGIRAVLVRGAEAGHGFTLSTGVLGYALPNRPAGSSKVSMDDNSTVVDYSPMLSATLALPQIFYSHASVTIDKRRMAAGMNFRPFYNASALGESVELLLQADLLFDKNARFGDDESLLIQTGVRFNTSEKLRSVVSFENFRTFMITLEFGL